MELKKYICRICSKGAEDINNGYLTRVNEFGGEALWECRPNCQKNSNIKELNRLFDENTGVRILITEN